MAPSNPSAPPIERTERSVSHATFVTARALLDSLDAHLRR
jgi:hypothetical protein